MCCFVFLIKRRPPRSTRTDTLFPYTTLFRSFLSGGDRLLLTPDGLATAGPVEHVYDPWHYPEDWVVESFSPEGPKIMQRGDYYYLITAVGGTAGPPTGHMVIAARSRSLDGPWENDPANPLVRTVSAAEKWWSRGDATVFEGDRK